MADGSRAGDAEGCDTQGAEAGDRRCCAWTCEALAIWISEKFGKTIYPDNVVRIPCRNGLSRQKARPVRPKTDAKAQERFQKRTCEALTATAGAHVGQKGRPCHCWWVKG